MEELLGRSKRDRVGKTLTGAEKEEDVIDTVARLVQSPELLAPIT